MWVFWNEERRETATKVERRKVRGEEEGSGDEDMDGEGEGNGEARVERESVNDRNDRGMSTLLHCALLIYQAYFITQRLPAIRNTLTFYHTHLTSLPPPRSTSTHPTLILLSDDRNNRAQTIAAGHQALSTREFVEGMEDERERVRLGDLVSVRYREGEGEVGGGEGETGGRKRVYPDVSAMQRLRA